MLRRSFLSLSAAGLAFSQSPADSSFTFLHFTDTHLQPELKGDLGTIQCFETMNRIPHDFTLGGGDLVFDVGEASMERSKLLWESYRKAQAILEKPVYCVPGNHDVYGMSRKSGVPVSDAWFGKKMFEDRIGARYRSFDHKGWHFILLDSVLNDAARNFVGGLDAPQMDWLKSDVASVGADTPIVVLTHIPIVTGAGNLLGAPAASLKSLQFEQSKPVLDLFRNRNLKAVLQGHTHIREQVTYKGCQFLTSGSVCGNWWKGARDGHPEGFAVLTVRDGQISWRYETFGWQAAV